MASKNIKSVGKVGSIIGLDPSSMGFNFLDEKTRLAQSDADYVEIIHTDSTKFGIAESIGHG